LAGDRWRVSDNSECRITARKAAAHEALDFYNLRSRLEKQIRGTLDPEKLLEALGEHLRNVAHFR
jgi:hypothetical protein